MQLKNIIDAVKQWIIRSLDIGPSRFLILFLFLGKTSFDCIKSKCSEIFVEESPAEAGDKVHSEGGEEQHGVRGRVPGVDVGHPHNHQGPDKEGDEAGGETKVTKIIILKFAY